MLTNNKSWALIALLGSSAELIVNSALLFFRVLERGYHRTHVEPFNVGNLLLTVLLFAVWIYFFTRATSWMERLFFATVLAETIFNGLFNRLASHSTGIGQMQLIASFIRCAIWLLGTALATDVFLKAASTTDRNT